MSGQKNGVLGDAYTHDSHQRLGVLPVCYDVTARMSQSANLSQPLDALQSGHRRDYNNKLLGTLGSISAA